jgi:hypothetical protein
LAADPEDHVVPIRKRKAPVNLSLINGVMVGQFAVGPGLKANPVDQPSGLASCNVTANVSDEQSDADESPSLFCLPQKVHDFSAA